MPPPAPDDVPDLLDLRGRLRRMAIAAALGVLAAVVVATITYALARHDLEHASTMNRHTSGGAWRFVIFFTGVAWIVTFIVSSQVMASREKRRNPHLPRAVARRKAP